MLLHGCAAPCCTMDASSCHEHKNKQMKLLRKLFLWLIVLPITLLLLLQLYFFAQIWWWVDHNPDSTSFMRHQLALLQEKNPKAQLQFQWVPYNRISNNLKRAIFASEDSNFS